MLSQYIGYTIQVVTLGLIAFVGKYYLNRINDDIKSLNNEIDKMWEENQKTKEDLIRLQEHSKDSSEAYKLRIEINDKYVLKDTYDQYVQTLLNNVVSLGEKVESLNNKLFNVISEKKDE